MVPIALTRRGVIYADTNIIDTPTNSPCIFNMKITFKKPLPYSILVYMMFSYNAIYQMTYDYNATVELL